MKKGSGGVKKLVDLTKAFPLVKKGNEKLLQPSVPVKYPYDHEMLGTIDAMKDCMRNLTGFWENRSLSMAAPQIGVF